MWRANQAVILPRFVLNQTSIDWVVLREGADEIEAALSKESNAGQSVRAQLGAGGGAKEGSLEAEED